MARKAKNITDLNLSLQVIPALLFGIALGILIVYPFIGTHPVRWALAIGGLALILQYYPVVFKK